MRLVRLILPWLVLGAFALRGLGATPPPDERPYPVSSQVLVSPAMSGTRAFSLGRGADGACWLAWIGADKAGARVHVARYLSATHSWSEGHTLATASHLANNEADPPLLAVGPDHQLAALWLTASPASPSRAQISRSNDEGATWSAPRPLTTESTAIEFPSLVWLPDGRLLAAWLDGRAHADGSATRLYARVVGTNAADTLIDDHVCDCCATGITVFPDGTALLVYRGRSEEEVRDIHVAGWDGHRWSPPRLLADDDWRINGCPVNGPRIAGTGGQAAVAWFTAAGKAPRVQVSTTPDAGQRFTMPQSIDRGQPVGRPDTLMLRDGSVLTVWLERGAEPGLWLRCLSPAGEPFAAVRLAILKGGRDGGFPRLALVKDYDQTPAQILVTYAQNEPPAGVHTLLVTLPTLSALAKRNPCIPCDENDANATRGYPVKARVTAVSPDQDLVTIRHEEIPGVMHAASLTCKVDPQAFPQLTVGRELIGRIERRDRDWWLFHIRIFETSPAATRTKTP